MSQLTWRPHRLRPLELVMQLLGLSQRMQVTRCMREFQTVNQTTVDDFGRELGGCWLRPDNLEIKAYHGRSSLAILRISNTPEDYLRPVVIELL